MPRVPPSVSVILAAYGPALLALVISLAAAWKCRKPWLRTAIGGTFLVGWLAAEPVGRWHGAAVAPGSGPGLLIVPAAAVAALEAVRAWRGARRDRLLAVAAAGFTGWWLARNAATPGEFWRVWFVAAMLVAAVAWIVRQQTMRGAAFALALWGGAVTAGFPPGWIVATAVLAAAWAGLLALGAEAAVPSALSAATLAGADLARGRIAHGHLDGADLACLLALAAPFAAGAVQTRLGQRWRALAPVLGAGIAVAAAWGLKRVIV